MADIRNRKVLIIGIDGGTWTILRPAIDQGFMPNLKEIVDSGASGILVSTMPAITPAAWGSFQTGVNCGRSGVFNFAYWDKADKKTHLVTSTTFPPTIWDLAGKAGKRVGCLNVPMTYPPREVNGCIVTGFLTPSLESNFTYPPELKSELLEAVPDYHIFNLGNAKDGALHDNFEAFVKQLADIAENRAKAAEFLINKEAFDLFMVHFQATDIIEHAMWCYLDQKHPMFDEKKCRFMFENFFQIIDDKIAQFRDTFRKRCGQDFLTLIVSDHGQETHIRRFNVGNWLCEQGFLKYNVLPEKLPLLKRITKKLNVGTTLKRFINPDIVNKLEKRVRLNQSPIDWHNSKAIAFGQSAEGFIYIISDNESEKQDISSDIISRLNKVIDPGTGTKIVNAIHRKEDIYHGPFMDRMPDLIVEPASGYTFTGQYLQGRSLFEDVTPQTDFHLGKHHKNGIIVAEGDGVEKSNSVSCNLIDMAPTLLCYLDVPPLKDMEGRIVYELFQKDIRVSMKQTSARTTQMPDKRSEATYSNKEQEQIEQRLKDLGYF